MATDEASKATGETLFVFLDESGDLQFGPSGSRHFVVSAVHTTNPTVSAGAMQQLKYDLLAAGSTDLEFHATENSRGTRKRVIDVITSIDSIGVHTMWIDKAFTHPKLQNEVSLLGQFGKSMGRWINNARCGPSITQVVLVFDSVLTGKKQDAFLKQLKPELSKLSVPYRVLFHPVKQDLNGQIADYFSWAWFRFVERDDAAPSQALGKHPNWSTFDLFNTGTTRYWQRPSP
ncbi:hypothetical protein CJ204_12320 [Corynebacterium xerosis]|uniref:DUF3800 domain-containing protein n=1 Tax=Corynebacterium xerosis TaxID=1725 RepID=A0A2N6SVU6_9CORY|nr:DUF3800 domain-containing protein [Corynebacterium xerosis]PMC61192.1 hypothetical protein CJ204_12320 [Corynebacterium xerosis]